MKKFFTMIAFVSALALSMTACTEEEVKPIDKTNNDGGGASTKGF
jgi:hypothetical protein